MPTKFLGSDFQINVLKSGDGIAGNQQLPQVTTLGDGRFAVVYQDDFAGLTTDRDPIAALFDADGTTSNPFIRVNNLQGQETQPDVAALPDGGFGVVFTDDQHADRSVDTNPGNITYQRVNANGTLANPELAIGDFNSGLGHDAFRNPAIATLSSGRQVVVFELVYSASVDDDIYLNVVSADGLTTEFPASRPLTVASSVSYETEPAVAAIGNTALIVYENADATTIVARLFEDGANSPGPLFTIADHTNGLNQPKITALDDHRYAIIYVDVGGAGADEELFGRIYDATGGGSLSAEFQIDQPGGTGTHDILPSITTTADGGFLVTWTTASFDVLARRFNSDGVAMGQPFIVNRLTDNFQGYSSVAVSGANAFFAWADFAARSTDTSPSSVRGQVMSLTTPPDFNDNGVSDMLWRKSDGSLATWDISKTGAIAGSSAVNSGGTPVAPDGSYSIVAESDFTGDGRADLVWRNTAGATSLWAMNGSSITSSSGFTSGGSVVNPDPSWSVIGAGDFNGDGMSDLLWRNTSTTQVAIWTMNGSAVTDNPSPTSGGTPIYPPLNWNMAGLGDFNGDGKSDLLWRNTSTGELAIWTMNGGVITNSAPATSGGANAQPNSDWSVAGVGDFNADGNADLLWRDSSSGALVEWLMNGSSILGGGSVMSGSTPVNPDPSWHVVEIGDFNDDARADILWRNDNGAMAEWFMKGTAIVGTATPSSGGATAAPDASWTVQAKPTDFA